MTIDLSDNSPRVSYAVAAGVTQSSFSISFEFFDNEDLNVYVDGVLKTLTTDYTVSGGDGSTGTLTMSVTGASGGSTVVITRAIDLERTTDFPSSGPFNIASLNTELDRFVAIAADLKDRSERALQLTDYDAAVSLVMPDVDTRKGKTLAFNASTGAVEAGPSVSDVQTVSNTAADIATLADIEDGTLATNAIQTVAGISSDVTTAAANGADISIAATNITDIQNASSNAATATTKASEAAASATASATSETNASTSETNAAASQVAAAASETASAASQVAAANSAAAAAAAFDNFDDTYLGSKTSDPTVDNDGDPLTDGDLYFNSAANEMRVYDGANWIAATSAGSASLINYNYTATANQNTFSGADDNALTLSYTQGNLLVTLNGIVLEDGADYTATNGTSVVLTSGAAVSDELNIVAFKSFSVANAYTKSEADPRFVPPGAIFMFPADAAPTGYLKANGATLSRATYAVLFAVIKTTFGAGDGSTTFQLPDLRGEFIRGWDETRGVDTGRVFGSAQGDAFQGHRHTAGPGGGALTTQFGQPGSFIIGSSNTYETTDPIADPTNGTPRVASETRPRNVALLVCIKY